MKPIHKGNLNKENLTNTRGWFIGHFAQDKNLCSDHFEIKWTTHPKGDIKPTTAKNKTAKTISILISGKFIVRYPQNNTNIILDQAGDYAYHAEGIYHTSEALEESTILTIRWPSIPGDQEDL